MKNGLVIKMTTVNKFVLRTLHRDIMDLAIMTHLTKIKIDIFKNGGVTKSHFLKDALAHCKKTLKGESILKHKP